MGKYKLETVANGKSGRTVIQTLPMFIRCKEMHFYNIVFCICLSFSSFGSINVDTKHHMIADAIRRRNYRIHKVTLSVCAPTIDNVFLSINNNN